MTGCVEDILSVVFVYIYIYIFGGLYHVLSGDMYY